MNIFNKANKTKIIIVSIILIGGLLLKLSSDSQTQNVAISQKSKETTQAIDTKVTKTQSDTKVTKAFVSDESRKQSAVYLLDNFIKLINNSKYNEAYTMLDEKYAKEFGITKELFAKKYGFPDNKLLQVRKAQTSKDRIILFTNLLSEVSIMANDEPNNLLTQRTFTILNNDKIIDIGIQEEIIANEKEMKGNIEVFIQKYYITDNGIYAKFNVKSNKEIKNVSAKNKKGVLYKQQIIDKGVNQDYLSFFEYVTDISEFVFKTESEEISIPVK